MSFKASDYPEWDIVRTDVYTDEDYFSVEQSDLVYNSQTNMVSFDLELETCLSGMELELYATNAYDEAETTVPVVCG